MARPRALSLALPLADPRSARIWAALDGLGPDADASAELRRLICAGLDVADRLDRIEAALAGLAGPRPAAPPPAPTLDAAALDALLDFGV